MSLFIFVFTFSLIFISLSVSVKGVMQCFPHIVILNERLSVGSSTPHQSYWTDLWRQARKMHNAKCKMANAKCIMMNLSLLNSYWTDLWGQARKMHNVKCKMANAKCIMMNLSLLNLIEPTSGDRQAKCKMMILSLLNSEPTIYSKYNKPRTQRQEVTRW